MKKIIFLILIFLVQILHSQQDTLNLNFKKNIVSANLYFAFGKNFNENGVQISYWRRNKIESKVHFEYGANFYYSPNKNPLKYIKNDNIYITETAGIGFDFGIKMVKEFQLKNLDFEWTNNLSFGAIAFKQNDIPKDERQYSPNENRNKITIDTNLGSLATINYGQSLRVFKKNLGLEISANYLPIYWIERKHLTEKMQVFRFGIGSVYRF